MTYGASDASVRRTQEYQRRPSERSERFEVVMHARSHGMTLA